MLFLISILGSTIICGFILYIMARMLHWKMRCETLICSLMLMNTVSGVWVHLKFYKDWAGIYDLMAFGKMHVIGMLPTVFAVNIILCGMILISYIFSKNYGVFLQCILCRKRKFVLFPIQAVKLFVVLAGSLYLIFSVADILMPQYAYWAIENENINYRTKAHLEIPQNTNLYGYPIVNPEALDTMEQEDMRILVIGDSFIWGDGTSNVNNLWWRILQRKIHSEGYSHCKVIAVGQCGASTQDELLWLTKTSMLEDIAPDMIIIGYVTNDAQYSDENGVLRPGQWAPGSHLEKGILKYIYRIFPNIAYKINNDLMSREIAMTDLSDQDLYAYSDWEYQIITGDNLRRYQEVAIEPLGEFLQDLSIPCCLMTTPNTPDYDSFFSRYKDVLPLFENADIPVYDCLYDFAEKYGQNKSYYEGINPVNGHPGIATNAYLADYAMEMIEKHYPAVLGEKNGQLSGVLKVNDCMPFTQMNLSVENNEIKLVYSNDWEVNCYLYMPIFKPTVKICFENTMDIYGFVIKDSDGNICNDFEIWISYINEEGYEDFITENLQLDGDVYCCNYENVTSINLHRKSAERGEKEYNIHLILNQ